MLSSRRSVSIFLYVNKFFRQFPRGSVFNTVDDYDLHFGSLPNLASVLSALTNSTFCGINDMNATIIVRDIHDVGISSVNLGAMRCLLLYRGSSGLRASEVIE